ncbi:MAG: L-histidine N(alpha)-methyltransferase [Bacteroidia bacterium]
MSTENIALIELKPQELEENFAEDVRVGLSAEHKFIPSKYFYDEEGSRLFEEIMKLPEYYPTRAETQVFLKFKEELLQFLSAENEFNVVDLGAGDGEKTKIVLRYFVAQKAVFQYTPIDISKDILEELLDSLRKEMPGLKTQAVVAEYLDALHWLNEHTKERKLVLFMGGNIGNFEKQDAIVFLRKMYDVLENDDLLLIGVDLKKDPFKIIRAYADSQDVTAKFNYNLLNRINNELGGNFDLKYWEHYASYDPHTGATKSFLISQKEQEVYIEQLKNTFHFDAFEAIHTEFSYKYTLKEIDMMAKKAGFLREKHFLADDNLYADSLWRVKK